MGVWRVVVVMVVIVGVVVVMMVVVVLGVEAAEAGAEMLAEGAIGDI